MSQAQSIVPIGDNGDIISSPNKPTQPLTVRALLSGAKLEELQKVAGAAMSAERLIKMFALAASRTPKLLECTPFSILDAMGKCAELKLMPGTLGSVYLIPYKNNSTGKVECQFMLGYRGMMTLARRAGGITTIASEVVFEGDEFEFEHGLEPTFRHRPRATDRSNEKITHAWAMAKFKDGSHQLAIMTKSEIDAIRRRSRASGAGPWVSDYAEMAKKTALRRLCKYLPLEPDTEAAIADVDRAEMDLGGLEMPEQIERPEGETKAESVLSKLTNQNTPHRESSVVADPAEAVTTGTDSSNQPAAAGSGTVQDAAAKIAERREQLTTDEEANEIASLLPDPGPTNKPQPTRRK